MKVLTAADLPVSQKTAVAIGLFDGVHVGHQALLRAQNPQYVSLVFTFDTKPNHLRFKNILSLQEKEAVFAQCGVELFYLQPFTDMVKQMEREAFLDLLIEQFGMAQLVVGEDFHFGKGARGNVAYLREMQSVKGFTLTVVPAVLMQEHRVSSTRIRKLLEHGKVREAADCMGRMYFVRGRVTQGNRIGRTIGFPTANLSAEKLLPKFGVYATLVEFDGTLYKGMTNVGKKPTIEGERNATVETHLLDFDGDLYGKEITVWFVQWIREERKFDGLAALKEQIARDMAQCVREIGEMQDAAGGMIRCE